MIERSIIHRERTALGQSNADSTGVLHRGACRHERKGYRDKGGIAEHNDMNQNSEDRGCGG